MRKEQAEDRLAELGVLLAQNSVIFRTKVHPTGSYNVRTRAWTEVRSVTAACKEMLEPTSLLERQCGNAVTKPQRREK